MTNIQIAHDLAVAKAINSSQNSDCKEIIENYKKFYNEFLNELGSDDKPAKIMKSPF